MILTPLFALLVSEPSVILREVHQMVPGALTSTQDAASADVNGDGRLDVLTATVAAKNQLYLGREGGGFTDGASGMPALESNSFGIALGDTDLDGDIDAVFANSGQNHLYVGDGGGGFEDATFQLPMDGFLHVKVAMGDVDLDGDPDLVFAGRGDSGSLDALYRNDGSGGFSAIVGSLPDDGVDTFGLQLVDVNGDFYLDLVLANEDAQNRLYLGDGAGGFEDATDELMPVDSNRSMDVAVFDANGDGHLDIAFANRSQQDRLYLGSAGGPFFELPGALGFDSVPSDAWAVGDVDSDGDLDLLRTVAAINAPNRLLLNNGSGVFTAQPAALPQEMGSTEIGLFLESPGIGGPNVLDLFLGTSPVLQDRLYRGSGTGLFSDQSSFVELGGLESSAAIGVVASADINGDGIRDVFVAGPPDVFTPGGNLVALGDGAGGFTAAPTPPPGTDSILDVEFGDLNDDGHLDALVLSGDPALPPLFGGADEVWIGDGSGGLAVAPGTVPSRLGVSVDAALGDLDGDGSLDALLATVGGGRLSSGAYDALLINTAGTFAISPFPLVVSESHAVVLADVDNDGDLDGVFATSVGCPNFACDPPSGGVTRLYRNGGMADFAEDAAAIPPIIANSRTLQVSDVDSDGWADIYVGGGQFGALSDQLFLNQGGLVFSDESAQLSAFEFMTRDSALADIDGDGFEDLVLAADTDGVRLLRGNGAGGFADGTPLIEGAPGDTVRRVEVLDLDRDGDFDLLVQNQRGQRLYTNVSHQLVNRAVTRLGGEVFLDQTGNPRDAWLLAFSSNSMQLVELPGVLGTLSLLVSNLSVIANGTFDASGCATTSFSVPGNPALSGVTLHWQAVQLSPLRLTNREITVLLE